MTDRITIADTMAYDRAKVWQDIIDRGEAGLARWSPNNPMRGLVERNIAEARAKLASLRGVAA